MARTGRPTKLTPQLKDQIVESLKKGLYPETAASLAGVTRETIRLWIRQGAAEMARRNKGDKPDRSNDIHAELAVEAARAVGHIESELIELVAYAAPTQWKAGAWLLERRFPARWSEKTRISEEQAVDALLDRIQGKVTSEAYRAVLEALADGDDA
jgi:hypothetical protein